MTSTALRTKTFKDLEALGFHPAKSLPQPNVKAKLRSTTEIAARLMGLDALFAWVAIPEKSLTTKRIQKHIERNALRDWLTFEEAEIIDLPRRKAHKTHVDIIGWKLENMWALAWVLGFNPEPGLDASQISNDVARQLLFEFLPGFDSGIDDIVAKAVPRSKSEVVAMEYRFYCAHNAVRSAQLGGKTVPPGFHPFLHGGAIHERRHALSWCLDPDVGWDDTDLST